MQLFQVSNTANNTIFVLARDSFTALSIAYSANHIRGFGPAKSDSLARRAEEVLVPYSETLKEYWSAIQLAITEGREGKLHLENGNLSVRYERIAP